MESLPPVFYSQPISSSHSTATTVTVSCVPKEIFYVYQKKYILLFFFSLLCTFVLLYCSASGCSQQEEQSLLSQWPLSFMCTPCLASHCRQLRAFGGVRAAGAATYGGGGAGPHLPGPLSGKTGEYSHVSHMSPSRTEP